MNVSLEYLERCSAETGFQSSVLEKVICLGTLAAEVTRHPFLGKVLALKGGTALNLCFGPPKRLSKVTQFLSLATNEKEYLAAAQRGEVKMELLITNNTDDAMRMAEHPVILWKIFNVREHLKRQRKKVVC